MSAKPIAPGHLYLVTFHHITQIVIATNAAHAIQIAIPLFFSEE